MPGPARVSTMKRDDYVIVLTCPKCRKRLRVRADMAGKRVRCPVEDCQKVISVPEPEEPEERDEEEVEEHDTDYEEEEEEEEEELERQRERMRRRKRRVKKKRRSAEFHKVRRQGAGILFGIAALSFLCLGLVLLIRPNIPQLQGMDTLGLLVDWIVVTLLFLGLGTWACFQPL